MWQLPPETPGFEEKEEEEQTTISLLVSCFENFSRAGRRLISRDADELLIFGQPG